MTACLGEKAELPLWWDPEPSGGSFAQGLFRMGMNDEEIVALSREHSLGK